MPSFDYQGATALTPGALAKKGAAVAGLLRNYKVAHQKVSMDIDLENHTVLGTTEIMVIPSESTLRKVSFDCRQMEIVDVWVNNRKAKFIYNDPLRKQFDEFTSGKPNKHYNDIHQHHFYKGKLSKIFSGENTEELTVLMPEKLKLTLQDASAIHTFSTPSFRDSPGSYKASTANEAIYTPVSIKIEYRLQNPQNGIHFIGGKDSNISKTEWHAYTSNSNYNVSTSSWVPCIDSLWEKSTWEFELSVPQTLKDIGNSKIAESNDSNDNDKKNNDDEEEDVDVNIDETTDIVVVGGDFSNQKETAHFFDSSKKIVSFSLFNPTSAHHVGWAVGPFIQLPLINLQEEEEAELNEEKDTTAVPSSIYCMPSEKDDALNSTIFLYKAIDFYSREFGSFPFTSYGLVFVSHLESDIIGFAGLSLISKKLLYSPNVIEPIYSTTYKLSVALSEQWSGINVVPFSFNDIWCTIGIAHFMALQFIRKLMGVNEYKYRIKKQSQRICDEDIGKRPLADPFFKYPISINDLEFIELKSPIVLFILDRRMTKTDKSFGLSRAIPKIFLQAMSGDLSNSSLSTQHFQYTCEKVNHNRLDSFFKEWVFGSGVPILHVTQRFNKKRMFVEVSIKQVQNQETKPYHPTTKSFIDDARSELETVEVKSTNPTVFTGPMTIRIHEADGTPYEHIVELKESSVKLDVQYNTKYKRLKKSQKDIKNEKERAERQQQEEEVVLLHCLGDILQSEQEKKDWGLVDWSKEQNNAMVSEAFEWIRIDSDFEWIAKIHIKQPEYMYASQLQQDRDIEAQIESINYFADLKPGELYSSILTRILMDERYYVGVRIEAAMAMAKLATQESKFLGMKQLLKAFRTLYCFQNSDIPLPNDFQNFSNYFVKKAIYEALSTVKNQDNDVPLEVRNFLLTILKYNENSKNPYSDAFYIGHLISCLTNSMITNPFIKKIEQLNDTDQSFVQNAIAEISRHQKLDEWIPSYNSIVGVVALQEKLKLQRRGLLQLDPENLLLHTTTNFPDDIRVNSFKGLFQIGGLKNKEILEYFFLMAQFEKNEYMKYQFIESFVTAFGSAIIDGYSTDLDEEELSKDIEISAEEMLKQDDLDNDGGMIVVEEKATDQFNTRKDEAAKASLVGTINLLRRDFGSFEPLKTLIWDALRNPLFSLSQKRNLFDLVSILYPAYDSLLVKFPTPREKKLVASRNGLTTIVLKREGQFKISLPKKLILPGASGASHSRSKSNSKPAKLATKPLVKNPLGYTPNLIRNKNQPLRYVNISTRHKTITVSSDPIKSGADAKTKSAPKPNANANANAPAKPKPKLKLVLKVSK